MAACVTGNSPDPATISTLAKHTTRDSRCVIGECTSGRLARSLMRLRVPNKRGGSGYPVTREHTQNTPDYRTRDEVRLQQQCPKRVLKSDILVDNEDQKRKSSAACSRLNSVRLASLNPIGKGFSFRAKRTANHPISSCARSRV